MDEHIICRGCKQVEGFCAYSCPFLVVIMIPYTDKYTLNELTQHPGIIKFATKWKSSNFIRRTKDVYNIEKFFDKETYDRLSSAKPLHTQTLYRGIKPSSAKMLPSLTKIPTRMLTSIQVHGAQIP